MDVNNLIIISDTHCGCQTALCPPKVKLDHGGFYNLSPIQQHLWGWWNMFWDDWVPQVTRGEPYAVVANGDVMDHKHHSSTTQISQNPAIQKKICREVWEPVVDRAKGGFYLVRGTEAHTGKSGHNEETIAEYLGAVPDEGGNFARYDLNIRVGNALCNILHHIGTTGSMHYETTAVMKELTESFTEAARWRDEPFDVVVRSHRHRFSEVRLATANGYAYSLVTPGWQGKTPFVWRLPGGRMARPQFGGVLIRQGDEEFYTRNRVWTLPRTKTEIPRLVA
jgi:hypothetical protein